MKINIWKDLLNKAKIQLNKNQISAAYGPLLTIIDFLEPPKVFLLLGASSLLFLAFLSAIYDRSESL